MTGCCENLSNKLAELERLRAENKLLREALEVENGKYAQEVLKGCAK